jgi:EAL domain-containing protein (putative c-di-GMP-specific phosphodiesterase class I)/CheY-like chemotaxis protein
MPSKTMPPSANSMPALLVIESRRFHRRALCRLLRAAGADQVAEAVDIGAAERVLAGHSAASWIVVADPDSLGADGLALLKKLASHHPATTNLLLSQGRPRAVAELRDRAREQGVPLLTALRKPVSAEEIGTILRQLAEDAQNSQASGIAKAPVLTKDELSECLRAGRLGARFQPKLDLESGRPVSCEALPYVTHARYGDVPAARFSHAMTQLGAQRAMTASVLRDAANLVRSLRAKGLDAKVAVNLPPDVLSEPGDATSLDAYVRTLGVAAADLALEIGASSSALSSASLADNLARLKVRGYSLIIDESPCPVALDDPAHAHFSELKLSWSAVSKRGTDPEASKCVAATISTARKYGLATCAVGVETPADLDQARRAGFELGQGELFAPSLPADETLTWVEREERTRSFADHGAKRHRAS